MLNKHEQYHMKLKDLTTPKLMRAILTSLSFLIGCALIAFAMFFLATGYDELWNGRGVWWYGTSWLITLITGGLVMINVRMRWVRPSIKNLLYIFLALAIFMGLSL
jgi:hypothetical protein